MNDEINLFPARVNFESFFFVVVGWTQFPMLFPGTSRRGEWNEPQPGLESGRKSSLANFQSWTARQREGKKSRIMTNESVLLYPFLSLELVMDTVFGAELLLFCLGLEWKLLACGFFLLFGKDETVVAAHLWNAFCAKRLKSNVAVCWSRST